MKHFVQGKAQSDSQIRLWYLEGLGPSAQACQAVLLSNTDITATGQLELQPHFVDIVCRNLAQQSSRSDSETVESFAYLDMECIPSL